MERPVELVPGTLELLVIKTLSLEPMHGWGIAQRLGQMSGGAFEVNQGSLYPALQRMKRRGGVKTEWRVTSNNRRARYYVLTSSGARQLPALRAEWERASGAVNQVLGWQGATA